MTKEYFDECPVCRRRVRANPAGGFVAHSRKRGGRSKNCPGASLGGSSTMGTATRNKQPQVQPKERREASSVNQEPQELDTISCAGAAQERARMFHRLEALTVADGVLHQNAIAELERRLTTWWGEIPLAPPTQGRPNLSKIGWGATNLPIVLPRDPIEQLILRAIAPAEPTLYGVTSEGAIYAVDAERNCRIFMGYLSPVLEEVANLFLIVSRGKHGQFFEDDGGFFADYSNTDDYRPFAVIGSERVAALADRCLDAMGDPVFRTESLNGLLVDFRQGEWPANGVLKVMGYHVGMTGLPTDQRRAILRKVVNVALIGTTRQSQAYVCEWGGPRSETRISKMASCLGMFASLAKRRKANMTPAVADWESDLRWLRNTYGR